MSRSQFIDLLPSPLPDKQLTITQETDDLSQTDDPSQTDDKSHIWTRFGPSGCLEVLNVLKQ